MASSALQDIDKLCPNLKKDQLHRLCDRRPIVIDGANVAIGTHAIRVHNRDRELSFPCKTLYKAVFYWIAHGHRVVLVIGDGKYLAKKDTPTLDFEYINRIETELLECKDRKNELGCIVRVPSRLLHRQEAQGYFADRAHDDFFVLDMAVKLGGAILSNDNYTKEKLKFPTEYSEVTKRLIKFRWIGEEIFFYRSEADRMPHRLRTHGQPLDPETEPLVHFYPNVKGPSLIASVPPPPLDHSRARSDMEVLGSEPPSVALDKSHIVFAQAALRATAVENDESRDARKHNASGQMPSIDKKPVSTCSSSSSSGSSCTDVSFSDVFPVSEAEEEEQAEAVSAGANNILAPHMDGNAFAQTTTTLALNNAGTSSIQVHTSEGHDVFARLRELIPLDTLSDDRLRRLVAENGHLTSDPNELVEVIIRDHNILST